MGHRRNILVCDRSAQSSSSLESRAPKRIHFLDGHFPVHPPRQQAEEAICDEMNNFAEPPEAGWELGSTTVLVRIPNAARRPSSQSACRDSQAAATKLLKDLDFLGEAKLGKAFSSFLPSHWYPLHTSF